MFFNNRKLENLRSVLTTTEAGIIKRIDENRELLELLDRYAPTVFQENPWVRGWIESQDIFLVKVAEAADITISNSPALRPFPVKKPERESPSCALNRMIKEVGICGLHHEIRESRITQAVRDYFFKLPEGEQALFIHVATEDYGINFDEDSFKEILRKEAECWKEIHKEQE